MNPYKALSDYMGLNPVKSPVLDAAMSAYQHAKTLLRDASEVLEDELIVRLHGLSRAEIDMLDRGDWAEASRMAHTRMGGDYNSAEFAVRSFVERTDRGVLRQCGLDLWKCSLLPVGVNIYQLKRDIKGGLPQYWNSDKAEWQLGSFIGTKVELLNTCPVDQKYIKGRNMKRVRWREVGFSEMLDYVAKVGRGPENKEGPHNWPSGHSPDFVFLADGGWVAACSDMSGERYSDLTPPCLEIPRYYIGEVSL